MTEPPIAGKLRFDPVITWGHVLLFAGFVISGIGVYLATELRATTLTFRVAALERISEDTKAANREMLAELKTLNGELIALRLRMAEERRERLQ